jgi:ankyrin repeat protein
VLKCLIEGSKQPADEVDRWGRTPFMVACLHGHLPVVRYLKEIHKVDIESPGEFNMPSLCVSLLPLHGQTISLPPSVVNVLMVD